MPHEFYFSIDAKGENASASYSAALIEKTDETEEDGVEYLAHEIRRYEDEPVADVAADLADAVSGSPFAGRTIFVANVGTPSGRTLQAELDDLGLSPITVTVTDGDSSPEQGRPLSFSGSEEEAVHVSEREIAASVERVYRSGQLNLDLIQSEVTSRLARGLEAFQIELDLAASGGDVTGEGILPSSDDEASLLLAAGTACWLGEQHRFDPTEHLAGDPPPVREAKRDIRPDTA